MKFRFSGPFDETLRIWLGAAFEALGHESARKADVVIIADLPENLAGIKALAENGKTKQCVLVIAPHPLWGTAQALARRPEVITVLRDIAVDEKGTLELARQIIAAFEEQQTNTLAE